MPNTLACEGFDCPGALLYPAGPKARYLPAPLIRARAEALNPRNCLDLARPARQALYGILAFFDVKRPSEPVFASRDNICAESLLGSHPTLYRGLAQLATKGYIRREQGRRRSREAFGQYSVSRIWLEDKALRLLGLVRPTQVKTDTGQAEKLTKEEAAGLPDGGFPQEPSITLRDRLQESEHSPNQQLSSKEQPPEPQRAGARSSDGDSSKNAIDNKTRLPTELVCLVALGLSRSRICGLMKLAREHGNGGQLGAVVRLVWERLQQLQPGGATAFAYLAKLVRQRKDYAHLVEIQDRYDEGSRPSKSALERLNGKLPLFLDRADGMQVVTRGGILLGVLKRMGNGGYVEGLDGQGVRRTLPVNARLIESWEEGDVVLRRANHGACDETHFEEE